MKRTRLRKMSDKRKAELPQRRAVVAAVLDRDRHECQARRLLPDVNCWGPIDVHELLPRGVGGDELSADGAIACCRGHHQHIHDHTAEAYELGLLRRRGDPPNGVAAATGEGPTIVTHWDGTTEEFRN